MGIALPDAPVLAMDEKFGPLIARDLAGHLDGRLLRPVHGAGAAVAGPSDSPPLIMRDHVLIAFAHRNLL